MTGRRTGSHEARPTALAARGWQLNLWAIWIAMVLALVGFDAAVPFLPYYVQELGIISAPEVRLWTGLLFSANSLALCIMGPIWGALADRMGRKLMVVRAMFGGALLIGTMAFVSNVHQLLVLRILQGAMTGFVTASFTLVAASVPEDQSGFAMGLLQMGVYVGAALGPALGGVVADTWGYRRCFLITGALMAMGGVLIAVLVRESRSKLLQTENNSIREGLQLVLSSSAIVGLLAVRSLVSSGTRTVNAMLPLFVQALEPTQERVASVVGVLNSANLAATAVGAVVAGRYADLLGHRRVLGVLLSGAAIFYSLQALAGGSTQLLILQALTGAAIGGVLSTLSASIAESSPMRRQGAVFGLQISFVQAASAVASMLGGAIAATYGLRGPFLLAAAACMLAAGLTLRPRPG